MKLYYVVLYPNRGYWRHFSIFADSPKQAINFINKFHRDLYKDIMEKDPSDTYYYASRAKHIVNCTRRINRHNRVNSFARNYLEKKYKIMEITNIHTPLEGHLELAGNLIVNILPAIDLLGRKNLK